ncbi:MAG TPA: dehydrogenase E1 component subunit alpha/beta [Candidatus Saccharimonadales bacterium]|nr:dehydrogenase E1 component subunit alpha/beta [Candidatus Saccharimonadales bacterium]
MTTASKTDALELYRAMQLIRQTEEQLARCHQRGLIHGACHTYVGQEAVAVGVCAHLRKDDVIFSTHRGHGHALAKGMPPAELVGELFGRVTGCSRGRGGSMHLFAPEIGMMGTSGIVGPCILQAAGAGYTFKLLKTNRVAVAFFGDGAVNNGAFHEGLNMASIWRLPVLFICENNQFATEVPFKYAAGNAGVANRGAAYGIPGVEVDGNDVLAVENAARLAVERARAGEGPTLIECKTYRTRPHSEGMGDYTYRTREEVAAWRERCPIKRLRGRAIEEKYATEAQFNTIDAEILAQVASATQSAENAPWPESSTASTHVYDQPSDAGQRLSKPAPAGQREISFAAATVEALDHEMGRRPEIFVMGEGIGVRGGNFGTTAGLFAKYGAERLCDTPICERGFVGLGCGAAMTGSRPVIDFMFVDFLNDAFGEIINQIAKIQYMTSGRLKMPILLRGCIGIGHSAATHHSGSYHSIYSHIPGLRVVVPSTPYDAKGLLIHALRGNDPVLFLEPRELMASKGAVPVEPYEIEFGKARIVREGNNVTVVGIGFMAHRALLAAEALATEGISVEVIDPRTVSPLDMETILASLKKTGRLLIVDEAFAPCSLGAEIAARAADSGFDDLDAPIRRLNGAFTPTPYSPPLEKAVIPQVDDIVQAMRELIKE